MFVVYAGLDVANSGLPLVVAKIDREVRRFSRILTIWTGGRRRISVGSAGSMTMSRYGSTSTTLPGEMYEQTKLRPMKIILLIFWCRFRAQFYHRKYRELGMVLKFQRFGLNIFELFQIGEYLLNRV